MDQDKKYRTRGEGFHLDVPEEPNVYIPTSSPVFVPGICCEHAWVAGEGAAQICDTCGATCVRDPKGKIIQYDAPE